jgi:hypothetical protein
MSSIESFAGAEPKRPWLDNMRYAAVWGLYDK